MMHSTDRRGFAIPTAILVIGVMTVTIAAGFALVGSERRTVDDQQLQVRALGIAQQGIEAYLRNPANTGFRPGGRVTRTPPGNNDTAWIPVNTVTGDTAIVIPRLFRTSTASTTDTMYVVTSIGRQGRASLRGTPPAVRIVAEIVSWKGTTIPIKGGWTSLTGMQKNGASGTLSGNDEASPPCLNTGNIAGVTVPTSPGYSGSTQALSGNPPLDNTSLGSSPAAAAATIKQSGIDWVSLSRGLNLPNVWRVSDYAGAFPSFADPNYYPTVYVSGDVPNLPNGRGLLVVSGNLIMNGLTTWNGIVLVGGAVTANGNNNVDGVVISGLNALLPGVDPNSIPQAALGNGTKTIVYNSCEVKKALTGTRALVPKRGTWMDNWRTY